MSGLEDILGGVLGGAGQGSGGMDKMLGQAKSAGVGDQAQSWVSKGENMKIGAVELEKVVGTDKVDEVAKAVGSDREQAANMRAQALPQVVDQVTPEGKVPDQAQLDAALGNVLEGKAA